jgi:hypothetical protein
MCKESYLKTIFNNDFQVICDANMHPFIDRDPTCFHYIVNYLRMGNNIKTCLPHDRDKCLLIEKEAQFYGLVDLIPLLKHRTRDLNKFSLLKGYLQGEENDKAMYRFIKYFDIDGMLCKMDYCHKTSTSDSYIKLTIGNQKHMINLMAVRKHLKDRKRSEWKDLILNYVKQEIVNRNLL